MSAGDLSAQVLAESLQTHLFPDDPGLTCFAVLDGASVPDLLPKLAEHRPEHVCLYRGELEPDLAECAPYLVRLLPNTPFTNSVLEQGWGQHWGIFALTKANLTALRKLFRTFLIVKNPEGKQLYFRYYDPRVLRTYLPTCNVEETKVIFGPVLAYLCEDKNPNTLLRFRTEGGETRKELIRLAAPMKV